MASSGVYIFAYGSLLHRPGFEYTRKVEGFITGWKRVWWQGSTDHRGTPAAPGRTVTLTREDGAKTWGAAYLLAGDAEAQAETLKYLEYREKQYDLREWCPVYGRDGATCGPLVERALVYIGTSSAANVNYLGPAPLDAIARQVVQSAGPSGTNRDYVFGLADAMRQMGVDDPELFDLEALVRRLPAMDAAAAAAASSVAAAAAVAQPAATPEP